MQPRKESERIRSQLRLKGWVDIDKVARRLGIRVQGRSFIGERVQEITTNSRVAVRQGLPRRERRSAVAHGIGHTILHPGEGNRVWLHLSGEPQNEAEREAEVFAFHLLVDRRQAFRAGLSENWEIAAYYGVPAAKMAFRALGEI